MEGGMNIGVSCCVALSFSTSEHLRSFFIDACCQTMGIFQYFDKNPNSHSIICKVACLRLCFEAVDVCCKGFFFLLLDIHEIWGIGLDISIAKFEPS